MVFLTAILLSTPDNTPRNTSPFPWCPWCLSLLGHPGEPRSGERVPAGLRWDAWDSVAAQAAVERLPLSCPLPVVPARALTISMAAAVAALKVVSCYRNVNVDV